MLRRTLLIVCTTFLFASAEPGQAQQAPSPAAPPLHAAWEGNWDNNGSYWSIMTVKVKDNNEVEVIYVYTGAPAYYTKTITDGKQFAFKWGQAAFEFALSADGKTLQGTRKTSQMQNTIAMTRMF